jgi:hypothetical protein
MRVGTGEASRTRVVPVLDQEAGRLTLEDSEGEKGLERRW